MKLLILGSGGRLGAALVRNYVGSMEVAGWKRPEIDLQAPEALREIVAAQEFNVLVNCAAQTNVDFCETHREEAFVTNVTAVKVLAEVCSAKSARLIHISTDYVFDGKKREPYVEEDAALPVSVYGESKRAGEEEMLAVSEAHLAVRVSWVFGPERPSFVDAILRQALEKEELAAIGDKFAVPSYTEDLATLLQPLFQEKPVGGVLHLSNRGVCTWRDYGEYAVRFAAQLGVPVRTQNVASLSLGDMKAFVAERPVYSALSTARYEQLTGITPPTWEAAVETYVRLLISTGKLPTN